MTILIKIYKDVIWSILSTVFKEGREQSAKADDIEGARKPYRTIAGNAEVY